MPAVIIIGMVFLVFSFILALIFDSDKSDSIVCFALILLILGVVALYWGASSQALGLIPHAVEILDTGTIYLCLGAHQVDERWAATVLGYKLRTSLEEADEDMRVCWFDEKPPPRFVLSKRGDDIVVIPASLDFEEQGGPQNEPQPNG